MGEHNTAVVLGAGRGRRMKSDVPKQFMALCNRPVLAWTLEAFQNFMEVQDIVLVTAEEEIGSCRREIVEKYGLSKVRQIVPGGAERCLSVRCGLRAADTRTDYVFIHDGVRPLVDEAILTRVLGEVRKYGAAAVGVPSKDTIKVSDGEGFVKTTPDRRSLWAMQTPQVFRYSLIREAYEKLTDEDVKRATDDAMVAEWKTQTRVKLVMGSYENIKITTPEDMALAELLLKHRQSGRREGNLAGIGGTACY